MSVFFELAHKTETILQDSAALSDKLGYEVAAQAIREQLAAFRQKELTVVVAGEARHGKSSLLNALLNEKTPLFPVDVDVCTNVVTMVRYGETEVIEAYIEDPKATNGCRIEKIRREQISDYVSEKGNPNNYKQVKLLKACIPNNLLKEGVVFVDTPGVGSLNIEHAETTYSFLPNADILLFVSDADSGLTESELNFLKRGYRYCKNILFPLTKKDLNANYTAILEDNRTKISQALEIPTEEVQIIPVSSTAKLRYLTSGSATMLTNSNYAALEDAIWTSIAQQKSKVMILPFLEAAKNELLKQADSIAAQYQVLKTDQGLTQKWIEELNRKTVELEELQEKGAKWRGQLAYFFTVLNNSVSADQREIGNAARTLADNQISTLKTKICDPKNYTQLVSDVNAVIGQGVIDVREKISDQIAGETADIQRQFSIGIHADQDILEKIGFVPIENLPVQFTPKKKMDILVGKGREISMSMMGASRVGMILGGAVMAIFAGPVVASAAGVSLAAGVLTGAMAGAGLGSTAGSIVGGAKGCIEALSKYDNMDVSTVNKTLNQYIAAAMSNISQSINNTVAELRFTLNDEFEQQLKRQIKGLKESTVNIQKNISLSKNEVPQKCAVLERQHDLLKRKLEEYGALEQAVTGLDQSAGAEAPGPEPAETEEISYGFL